jgi:ubiquinone/menaquinone biosynthesis C-methylase UbiE
MPADYALLAPIYDRIALSRFSETFVPSLFSYAQQRLEWVGRRVLELGTGTGHAAHWIAKRGLNVTAVDTSEAMLSVASHRFDTAGIGLSWRLADLRTLDDQYAHTDLVIALDVVNDLNSLKELEAMFATAMRVLEPGKLFLFDMVTIAGLAKQAGIGEEVFSDEDLTVFATRQFDYDRQTNMTRFTIFQRDRSYWLRNTASLTQRGYASQAVHALLTRAGFARISILNTAFEPQDPNTVREDHVVFAAFKPGGDE